MKQRLIVLVAMLFVTVGLFAQFEAKVLDFKVFSQKKQGWCAKFANDEAAKAKQQFVKDEKGLMDKVLKEPQQNQEKYKVLLRYYAVESGYWVIENVWRPDQRKPTISIKQMN